MKRIIFLRNRVVPAHAGKLEARGVLDLAEARDGPGSARESTHGEPCVKNTSAHVSYPQDSGIMSHQILLPSNRQDQGSSTSETTILTGSPSLLIVPA